VIDGAVHFAVDVIDLGRAEAFYTRVLGMGVTSRRPEQLLLAWGEGHCVVFLAGESRLARESRLAGESRRAAALAEAVPGSGHPVLPVSWAHLLLAVGLLAERGLDYRRVVGADGIPRVLFVDPDDNVLELTGGESGRAAALQDAPLRPTVSPAGPAPGAAADSSVRKPPRPWWNTPSREGAWGWGRRGDSAAPPA
jgi:catechol 2,3-dioxygenase-like lactoylglutathione lyase family enzyme